MNVQGEVIAEVVHHPERRDDGAILQVDDVDGAVALAGAVEARGERVVAPEIHVADGAAGGQAFDVVDVLVSRLRSKIDPDKTRIETLRGVGYVFKRTA